MNMRLHADFRREYHILQQEMWQKTYNIDCEWRN